MRKLEICFVSMSSMREFQNFADIVVMWGMWRRTACSRKKEQKVRFGLHLRASPKKKFVAPTPERQNALAKKSLNFDDQGDDRRQGERHGKGGEVNKEKEQRGAGKLAAPDANTGGGLAGADAANDIARKVLTLGVQDTPPVIPPLVFQGCLQVPAGCRHGPRSAYLIIHTI